MQVKSIWYRGLPISALTCEELGTLYAHLYNKERLNRLGINYFIGPNRELKSQRKPVPRNLGRQTNADPAKICLTGAEATEAINRWKAMIDHFKVLLEA